MNKKRKREVMLAYPFEPSRLNNWSLAYVQPKLDGDRCRALVKGGEVTLLTSEGNIIKSVPHIEAQLKEIVRRNSLENIEFDGELYKHGVPHQFLHSIVSRKTNLHPNYEDVEYHIFDIADISPQYHRFTILSRIDLESPSIKVVDTNKCCATMITISDILKDYIEMGYEGIIVRHPSLQYTRKRTTNMMKWKPAKSDTYRIVGFTEEISKDGIPKGRLGALLLEDQDGFHFSVGTGFNDYQREAYWTERDALLGMKCTIKYQQLTERGVPRFPVFMYLVDKE